MRAGIDATELPAAGSDETSVACADAMSNTRITSTIANAAIHPPRRAANPRRLAEKPLQYLRRTLPSDAKSSDERPTVSRLEELACRVVDLHRL